MNVQDKDGKIAALLCGLKEGHLEVVKALVRAGAKLNVPDKGWRTALISASTKGHLDIVKASIAAGAELNLQNEDGPTALFT